MWLQMSELWGKVTWLFHNKMQVDLFVRLLAGSFRVRVVHICGYLNLDTLLPLLWLCGRFRCSWQWVCGGGLWSWCVWEGTGGIPGGKVERLVSLKRGGPTKLGVAVGDHPVVLDVERVVYARPQLHHLQARNWVKSRWITCSWDSLHWYPISLTKVMRFSALLRYM